MTAARKDAHWVDQKVALRAEKKDRRMVDSRVDWMAAKRAEK